MDYPKTLTPSDWDKKKGLIAKSHATGIGDALKTLEKLHGAIDWAQCNPLLWAKTHATAQAFEQVMDDKLKQVEAKLPALKQQAEKVEVLARKWVTTFTKDKLVPKSAAQAAQAVADAADGLAKGLKPWMDQVEKQANAVLARLPSPDAEDEPQDKLLSADFLKATLVRCRNNEALTAQFAYCPPLKDAAGVFVAHTKIPAKRLLAKVRDASGAPKGICGTLRIQEGQLLLTIDKALPGLVKQIRALVLEAGLRFKSIRLLDERGTEIEKEEDQDQPLERVDQELKLLTPQVSDALKRDPSLRAALLAAVSGVQNGIKRGDIDAAQLELTRLKALVQSPGNVEQGSRPSPETRKSDTTQEVLYEGRKKQMAQRIKAALGMTAVAEEIKRLFSEAEGLVKQGQVAQGMNALTALQERLDELDQQRQQFESQVKTVMPVIVDFLKTISVKNQARIAKVRELMEAKATAGDFVAALRLLPELPKLANAIKKESAPSTANVSEEDTSSAGDFLRSMNEESDWQQQSALVEELRKKLGDLKGWDEPDHADLLKQFTAMEETAGRQQHVQALALLEQLSPKVLMRHGQYPDRKSWRDLDAKRKEVQDAIDALVQLNAPEVAALRYDQAFANSMGAQEKYNNAMTKLNEVHNTATTLLNKYNNNEDFRRWAAMDVDVLKVDGQLKRLERTLPKLFKPTPGEIATRQAERTAIRVDVQRQRYAAACDKLTVLAPLVASLHDASEQLTRHRRAINELNSRMSAADAIRAVDPLTAQVQAYATAQQAAQNAFTLSRAGELDGLRDTLTRRLDELLQAYALLTDEQKVLQPNANRVAFMSLHDSEVRPMLKIIQAKTFKPITGAMESQMREFNTAVTQMDQHKRAGRFAQATVQANELIRLGRALQDAQREAGRAGASFNKRWSPLTKRIDGLKGHIENLPEPHTPEQTRFMQALETMTRLRGEAPVDFEACLSHLKTKLEPALRAALDKHAEQTQEEIRNANDTTKAEDLINGKQAWELEALPPQQRVELLRNLRKAWGNPPSDDKRAAQRKVYAGSHLDEEFVAYDKEQRAKIVEALRGDKEMKQAQTGWGALSWPDRLKQLQRVATEQCKAYDFGPPPVVKLVDLGGNASGVTNGYFDPGSKCIVINTNPYSSANDFGRAVDLIIHENSHYYQDQLCTGMIDAGSRDKRLLTQTELFKVNSEPGAYVSSGEAPNAHAVYQQQPLEEHAHLAGPKAAKAILAAL